MTDFSKFSEKIGIKFKDENLLKQAFTHRSYLNENPDWPLENNERLEFLGDAVLELCVSEFLYERYPEKPEGELTSFRAALVNAQSLSEAALKLDIGDYLLLSKGEEKEGGRARQTNLSNAFEALIGAIYLDAGYKEARSFMEKEIFPKIEEVISKGLHRDPKSFFQEKAQEITGITPVYKVLREWGPDHDKHFLIGAYLGQELIAEGEGQSKQEAETEAARKGLEVKKWM